MSIVAPPLKNITKIQPVQFITFTDKDLLAWTTLQKMLLSCGFMGLNCKNKNKWLPQVFGNREPDA